MENNCTVGFPQTRKQHDMLLCKSRVGFCTLAGGFISAQQQREQLTVEGFSCYCVITKAISLHPYKLCTF